ncbi:MAG TPA: isoamylase early set domain-containing protein [Gemmatimonadaceae bacterium]
MTDEHDETIERIAAELRPLPEVDSSAKARVLVAVAAERAKAGRRETRRLWRGARWGVAIIALAAAAAFATFTLRAGARVSGSDSAARSGTSGTPSTQPAPLSALGDAGDAAGLQRVQLVLRAADAHHVSVVGDFTGWDERRAAMTRDPASGLWSVTLALRPGRHVYAYLVDDSIWVRDPRAPVAADADFGRPGSVLLVGRP